MVTIFFISLLIFSLCLWGVWSLASWSTRKAQRTQRDHNLEKISGKGQELRFASANASTDLLACVRRLNLSGAKISVMAGAGDYLLENPRDLTAFIEYCLAEGADLEYVFTRPSDKAKQAWQNLVVKLAKKSNLQIEDLGLRLHFVVNLPQEMTTYVRQHPTVISMADGATALWFERNHPAGSTVAFGVSFLDASALEVSDLWQTRIQKFKKDFTSLINFSEMYPKYVAVNAA